MLAAWPFWKRWRQFEGYLSTTWELDLFEESYNDGYETGIKDFIDLLISSEKIKEDKSIYYECAKKLLGKKIKE